MCWVAKPTFSVCAQDCPVIFSTLLTSHSSPTCLFFSRQFSRLCYPLDSEQFDIRRVDRVMIQTRDLSYMKDTKLSHCVTNVKRVMALDGH